MDALPEGDIPCPLVEPVGVTALPRLDALQGHRHLVPLVVAPRLVVLEPPAYKGGDQGKVSEGGERRAVLHLGTVGVRATAVLGWTGMLAGDAHRVHLARVGWKNVLEANIVVPPCTKVIAIIDALGWPQVEVGDRRGSGVVGKQSGNGTAAVVLAMNAKGVQMDIFPAHRNLNDVMESGNRRIALYEHTAPDYRGHMTEHDLDLENAWQPVRLTHYGEHSTRSRPPAP